MTGLVTAVHLYVTDLDQSTDFYSRLLGYGPAAAYDEGENAHSAFFVLEQQTFLVLTWDPDRGREVGGAVLDRRHEPRASDPLTGLRAHLDDQRLVVAVT